MTVGLWSFGIDGMPVAALVSRQSDRPILQTKAGHAGELAGVVRHEDEALRPGVSRDHCVVRTNGRANFRQFRPELAGVGGSGAIVVEDFKASQETLNDGLIARGCG
ncbi:hypothetical protein G6F31_021508 [Rhizopus arrhizus]|nr:hypothetical protein G6F31_021508 [Rhizopus arrhizus]